MAYEWQSDIIRPDSENPGTEVLDGNGVVQPQIEGGDNITIANGRINASGTPGQTYTAGDGIDITSDVVSADVDGTTIGIDASTKKIKSLQTIPTKTSDLQNDSGFITSADIPAQVNADWTSDSGVSEILHKPDLSIYAQSANLATVATTGDYSDLVNKPSIPAAQVNSDWNSNSGVSQILNKPSLAIVATTGDYSDLLNKPSIPAAQVNADWNSSSGVSEILNKPSLATVATTGAYSDLTGTPSIPTATSDLTNDSGYITLSDVPAQVQADWNETNSSSEAYIQNKPTIPAAQVNSDWNASSGVAQILNKPNLATVATTGAYSDLTGTPTIPATKPLVAGSNITITENTNDVTISAAGGTVDQTYNSSSTNAQSGTAVAGAIAGVNQVPSSSASDENKVLTVNSSGTPVWAEAQGGSTSEFPYDPGYMHTGWNKMIVRFGDTTYDPTTKASADKFNSITAMSDPGVYEYTFKSSSQSMNNVLKKEWNDITNNPVDILQLTSDDLSLGGNYTGCFRGCTGLRSVWNIRGSFGAMSSWFRDCTRLVVVDSKAPEHIKTYLSDPNTYSIGVTDDSSYIFSGDSALKYAKVVIKYSTAATSNNISYGFYTCSNMIIGASVIGYCGNASRLYQSCSSMDHLYGISDDYSVGKKILLDEGRGYDTLDASYSVNGSQMFYNCGLFRDFNGNHLRFGPFSNISNMFEKCSMLESVPPITLNQSTSAASAFSACRSLKTIPELPYDRISSADHMFENCWQLTDVTALVGLATSVTNVTSLLYSCFVVVKGVSELYAALSANANVTSHNNAFFGAGVSGWNNVLSTIPSSWGGTGA